jgi:phytanoyl-CoA hydroxylase
MRLGRGEGTVHLLFLSKGKGQVMLSTLDLKSSYEEQGYAVARQLFTADEVALLREHYMRLRAQGPHPGDLVGVDATSEDPLKRYPRMIHMHHWDEISLRWLLDERLNHLLTSLVGQEPYAVQTMLYFKPPQARGQALHQDQFFLKVQPGTCIAAWLALDPCDEANGCMQVVPRSHRWSILCTTKADTTISFTDVTIPLPEGQKARPVLMEAGDVLFFGGSLVHGSFPNTTAHRFRRALIGHYISGDAEHVTAFMRPVLRMDGSIVTLKVSEPGGPCGVWVEKDGQPVIELSGIETNTTFRSE